MGLELGCFTGKVTFKWRFFLPPSCEIIFSAEFENAFGACNMILQALFRRTQFLALRCWYGYCVRFHDFECNYNLRYVPANVKCSLSVGGDKNRFDVSILEKIFANLVKTETGKRGHRKVPALCIYRKNLKNSKKFYKLSLWSLLSM